MRLIPCTFDSAIYLVIITNKRSELSLINGLSFQNQHSPWIVSSSCLCRAFSVSHSPRDGSKNCDRVANDVLSDAHTRSGYIPSRGLDMMTHPRAMYHVLRHTSWSMTTPRHVTVRRYTWSECRDTCNRSRHYNVNSHGLILVRRPRQVVCV